MSKIKKKKRMKFSDAFLDIRIEFECSGDVSKFLKAYKDIAGIWTIGIGTTHYPNGNAVQEGDHCDIEQAKEWAAYDAAYIEEFLNKQFASIPSIIQCEFDAIGDFCYNVGIGAWNSSSLKKEIVANTRNFNNIAFYFKLWDKAHVDGELVKVPGLLRRRKCEAYLYEHGINHPTFFKS